MRFCSSLLLVLLAPALPLAAQPGPGRCCMGGGTADGTAPIASNPVVEVRGTVAEVQIAPGQGMPYLTVKQGNDSTRVYLGAMHYLISENFNPKAGQQVAVKGYKSSESIIGIQVSLPAEGKTIKLRDDKGWPLWRRGPMGGTRSDTGRKPDSR